MQQILTQYLKAVGKTTAQGDAREESYYDSLKNLLLAIPLGKGRKTAVTVLPKTTEAGNPDFRVWDGDHFVVGYIEAKAPGTNLDQVEASEQLQRYLATFPNLILTDFYEFRLYRDGNLYQQARIGRHFTAQKLKTTPALENQELFQDLSQAFFDFKLPKHFTAESLAIALAKRTRFLRDQVISEELQQADAQRGELYGYYQAFQKYLIPSLSPEQFADLYAQTIAYSLFAARTRVDGEFKRAIAVNHIPHTTGILRDVFRFISLGDMSDQMQVTIDDIVSVLNAADIKSILDQYYQQGKGEDPIIHFYETFLNQYDPQTREKRGVYYTPEPVVRYIVRSVHEVLKRDFNMPDGLADDRVTLLDPAAGTLTFPAEAIKLAVQEYTQKYGEGGKESFIRNHILQNFYAFELMMAPYAIGHMKIGYLLESLGFHMRDSDSFKLYLTNTLEMDEIMQSELPGVRSLSEESRLAGRVKREPILVILGNPPYSGHSANRNDWTEKLLKEDLDGAQSYYKVDGKPLGERNPKWLQDDYVKFLRFAQWKIQKAGQGIVAMITNHAWLDNPTFRGMRQSLMRTFDTIQVLDLHGNAQKREMSPDGTKDENVFDIMQGVAITLLIKNSDLFYASIKHVDMFGLRASKYQWLENITIGTTGFQELSPAKSFYFFIPWDTQNISYYNKWPSVTDIFPVNSIGIVTSRDNLVIDEDRSVLEGRMRLFMNKGVPDEVVSKTLNIKNSSTWDISKARMELAQITDISPHIKELLYRPFDKRNIIYEKSLIERMRLDVMSHVLDKKNLVLLAKRQGRREPYSYYFVSDLICESCVFESAYANNSVFPLYLYEKTSQSGLFDESDVSRVPNISMNLWEKVTSFHGGITPESLFFYIYGIMNTPIYRNLFLPFLKIDFPRIPFTSLKEVFDDVAMLGGRLVSLHLLKSPEIENSEVKFQGSGLNHKISSPRYLGNEKKLYINNQYFFENMDQTVWDFKIGGYQVLDKYLKNRKGQTLEDPRHIIRIATALAKTIEIQAELDEIYPEVEKDLIDFS